MGKSVLGDKLALISTKANSKDWFIQIEVFLKKEQLEHTYTKPQISDHLSCGRWLQPGGYNRVTTGWLQPGACAHVNRIT
jgi:hypothetical protein